MKIEKYPSKKRWALLTQRPKINSNNLVSLVQEVFKKVEQYGDKAVQKYALQFDGIAPQTIVLNRTTAKLAAKQINPVLKKAIQLAKKNIEQFHAAQKEAVKKITTTKGVSCWRESRPIEKVGLYIPGGTAPLFSTVLMLGIPAKLAGCKEIVLCTPPDKTGNIHPAIIYAAYETGIDCIYAVGGIQAIAAMSIGTTTISKVDKIFGPGNQYVTAAKQMAQSIGIAIDMPAGPSELLIIADTTCNSSFVAADLLSQAEHGIDSQVILLSDAANTIEQVLAELKKQLQQLPRKDIAAKALQNSKAIVLKNLNECVEFSNAYAPEHLILATQKAMTLIKNISNAGSVFIGNYSCESAGDYASGTNHTLPTNGFAKMYSGVSLDSFVKKITFQEITKKGLQQIGPAIECMAEAEQLFAHKNAVTIRLKK